MAQARRKKNFLGGLFGRRSDYAKLLKELQADPDNRSLQREVIVAGREKNKTTEQMKSAFRKAGVSTYDTRQALARFVEERQRALKQERKKEKKKSRKAGHQSSGKKVVASSASKTPAVSLGGEKLPANLAAKIMARIKPNGKKAKKPARKKNKTVIVKPRKVTVINGKKKSVKKASTKRATSKRKNLDHPDRNHQVQVSKHWRAGGASGWQRAAAAGQKDLFEHGIKKRGNGKGKKKTTRSAPKRRNSESSAAALYEMFQGRESQRAFHVQGDTSMPATAAAVGLLKELKLENGKTLKFTRMDGIYLAMAKVRGRDQLYIVGNYKVEVPAGVTVPIHISQIVSVTYETHKAHIGDGRTYEFEHEFGEEGGARPWLTLDPSGKMHVTGGSYVIRREGIRD